MINNHLLTAVLSFFATIMVSTSQLNDTLAPPPHFSLLNTGAICRLPAEPTIQQLPANVSGVIFFFSPNP